MGKMCIKAMAAVAACAAAQGFRPGICAHAAARPAAAPQAGLRIEKALYGDFSASAARPLCREVSDVVGRGGEIPVSNATFGGDPCHGMRKELEVVYVKDGVRRMSRTPEHASFALPRGATVVSAWYGVTDPLWTQPSPQAIDVTAKLAACVKPGGTIDCERLDCAFAGGDPAYGVVKETRITYVRDGVRHTASVPEGGSFRLQ